MTTLVLLAQPGAEVVSLSEALRRAERASPLVQRAQAERRSVEASRVGAGLVLPSNPEVSGWVGGGREANRSGAEGGVRLQQSVEVFNQRGTRLAEVDARVKAAEVREALAVQETRARTMAAYLDVQTAALLARDAADRLQTAESFAEAVKVRVEAGAIPETDLLLAQTEVAKARAEKRRAEVEQGLATADLAQWLQWDSAGPLAVSADAPSLRSPDGDRQAWLDRATRLRADRQVLSEERSSLDATLIRLSREALPSPTVFVEWNRSQPADGFGVIAGLSIPLPLVRRNQGEKAIAQSQQRRLELETALFDRQLRLELNAAGDALEGQLAQLSLFEKDVLPPLDAALAAVERGSASGKFDVFRVLQLRRERADARRELRRLFSEAWRTRIELHRLTGDS